MGGECDGIACLKGKKEESKSVMKSEGSLPLASRFPSRPLKGDEVESRAFVDLISPLRTLHMLIFFISLRRVTGNVTHFGCSIHAICKAQYNI